MVRGGARKSGCSPRRRRRVGKESHSLVVTSGPGSTNKRGAARRASGGDKSPRFSLSARLVPKSRLVFIDSGRSADLGWDSCQCVRGRDFAEGTVFDIFLDGFAAPFGYAQGGLESRALSKLWLVPTVLAELDSCHTRNCRLARCHLGRSNCGTAADDRKAMRNLFAE